MNNYDFLRFNIHWQARSFTGLSQEPFQRKLYSTILANLETRFILSIQGLRRTGKSVMQRQLCRDMATRLQISPEQLLYYSFDLEDDLDLHPPEVLSSLFEQYFKDILRIHPQNFDRPIIIALDEIQNVRNWQGIVKSYYDLNPKIKFIITGSSSLFLQEGSESLAGRIIEYHLPCLDFEEFLIFAGKPADYPFISNIREADGGKPFYLTADPLTLFESFLLVGGFPDTAIMFGKDAPITEIQRFIRDSIVNKVIKKDLKKYFHVKDTHIDHRLFEIVCNESGSFIEFANLASQVGLSKPSIRSHLDIFTQSQLCRPLYKFDRKLRREISATRKYYVSSPCLMYSLAHKTGPEDSAFLGHAAETYAFNKLCSYSDLLYVHRGQRDREEIDFYLPHESLFIECKYTNKIDSRSFSYLQKQSSKVNAKHLVLSKKDWIQEGLNALPLFLL